ncbi:DUF6182 family protein [Streptomyces katsurahamanus]|uniref:Uncharacterized protein n=1 Tax=Streptomyces katsurahamanus TaxID=2577098 RepID=A0ABW9NQ90_9ACTN|nr:DUF6182 family protein [Streptomyces katsurahamanus]MQS35239.1 hypothetical protein [Streptomyces katsurahamanus]
MTLSPTFLLSVAADRLRTTRPDLAADLDLTSLEGLRGAQAVLADREAAEPGDRTVVVAVVGDFDLPRWVVDTCRFALAVPAERAGAWRHAFTRTVYLAGRPDSLRKRFAFDHVAEDGSIAWSGPAPEADTESLRRLLKTFSGVRELTAWAPVTVTVPEAGAPGRTEGEPHGDPPPAPRGAGTRRPLARDLYIATARVTVADALVQVNHLLVESAMDGTVGPGDRLTLRSVPRLTGLSVPLAALRVDTDPHRPGELRAYAGLTEPPEDGSGLPG